MDGILEKLSRERPFFHSERDFQFAKAWKIKQKYPEFKLRLEKKENVSNEERIAIDICVLTSKTVIPIEIKHQTKHLLVTHEEEIFALADHGAEDHGRYDFLKDIMRIESVIGFNQYEVGFAIMLTNNPLYWQNGTKHTFDEEFRIHDDRRLKGKLQWKAGGLDKNKETREKPIKLSGKYNLKWIDYHKSEIENCCFKYLKVKI